MKKEEKIKSDLAILPIGAMAQALKVHPRTLRIYDEEGILSPKRTAKNRRNYSLDDLEKARTITFLTRNLALNLSAVKIIYAIMKDAGIKSEDYLKYIKKIAQKANITDEVQEENIKKNRKQRKKTKNQSVKQ